MCFGWELSDSDKLGLITNVVSWVLIFGGWYIVNRQNNKRETRKELRAAFDEIHNNVRQLSELGINYHIEGHNDDLMFDIVSMSKRLNKKVNRLKIPFNKKTGIVNFLLIQKRKLMLVNNFGSSTSVVKLNFYSNEIASIENATENLLDEIEKVFNQSFSKVKNQ